MFWSLFDLQCHLINMLENKDQTKNSRTELREGMERSVELKMASVDDDVLACQGRVRLGVDNSWLE